MRKKKQNNNNTFLRQNLGFAIVVHHGKRTASLRYRALVVNRWERERANIATRIYELIRLCTFSKQVFACDRNPGIRSVHCDVTVGWFSQVLSFSLLATQTHTYIRPYLCCGQEDGGRETRKKASPNMGKLVVLWGERERGPNRSVIFLLLTGALIVAPPIKTGSRWLQERICTGTTARNSPTQGGSLSLFLIFCLFNQKKNLVFRHTVSHSTFWKFAHQFIYLQKCCFFGSEHFLFRVWHRHFNFLSKCLEKKKKRRGKKCFELIYNFLSLIWTGIIPR